jgi:cell shape-determining protein MreC
MKLLVDLLDIFKNLKNSLSYSFKNKISEKKTNKKSLVQCYFAEPKDLEKAVVENNEMFLRNTMEFKEINSEVKSKNCLWSLDFFVDKEGRNCVKIGDTSVFHIKAFLDFILKVFSEVFYNKKIINFFNKNRNDREKEKEKLFEKQRHYLRKVSCKHLTLLLDLFDLIQLNNTYKVDSNSLFESPNHLSSNFGSFIKKIRFSYNENQTVRKEIEEFIKTVYIECTPTILRVMR